ncbi:MAG: ExbD/TolR family protein [Kiritimatiellia bacterium]
MNVEENQSLEIQMGPMIDCVFLLLLYFMTSAQIKPEEKYLGINIPSSAVASKESLPAELTVAILDTGEVLCNQVPVGTRDDRNLDGLRAKLNQVIQLFGDKQPVVLHPQPKVRHQQIVDVLNACAASGVKNLSFFANP